MQIKTLAVLAGLVVYSLVATGCATIMKGDKSNVYLVNAPSGIKVYENDQLIPINRMDAHELYSLSDAFSDEANSTSTSYTAWGMTFELYQAAYAEVGCQQHNRNSNIGANNGNEMVLGKFTLCWSPGLGH